MVEERPTLLMLAAHEPTRDPRIDWEASSAAPRYAVTVLGLAEDASMPVTESVDAGYRIRRIALASRTQDRLLHDAFRLLFEARVGCNMSSAGRTVALVLLSPLLVGLGIVEAAIRTLLWLTHRLRTGGFWSWWLLKGLLRPASLAIRRTAVEVTAFPVTPTNKAKTGLVAQFRLLRFTMSRIGRVSTSLWSCIEETYPRPDVVHANDLETLLAGVLTRLSFGSRLIYDAHEYYPHAFPGASQVQVRLLSSLEKLLVQFVDEVVTVSDPLARDMEQSYGLREVHVVPNAEPWREQAGVPAASRSKEDPIEHVAQGRTVALFQGQFAAGRGLEELVNAWPEDLNESVVLVLRGPRNPHRDSIESLAASQNKLGHCIFLLPPVSEAELVSACIGADLGVIPYRSELLGYRYACPNKLSQYLQAGLAILTTDIPYVEQLVNSHDCGWVFRQNEPETLAAALREFSELPALLTERRTRGLELARTEFNWQRFGPRLLDLYSATPRETQT